MGGGGSPRAFRRVIRLSESASRVLDASDIISRRDSRVSMPSLARRMSDCRSWRDLANRRRFSDSDDRGDRACLVPGDADGKEKGGGGERAGAGPFGGGEIGSWIRGGDTFSVG